MSIRKLIFTAALLLGFALMGRAEVRDTVKIAFRPQSNIIYDSYMSNSKDLATLNDIIAQWEDVILTGNGHIRLVANIPVAEKENLIAINLGAMRAAAISNYLRSKFRFLTRWNFSFLVNPTDELRNSITVSYIPFPLALDAPNRIYYTEDKQNLAAIKGEMRKYGGIPYLSSAKVADYRLSEMEVDRKATAAIIPNSEENNAHDVLIAIYYRWNKSNLDSLYLSNPQHLAMLDSILRANNLQHIDTLTIVAFASPEGNPDYNKQLSERRANTIRDHIVARYPSLAPDRIVTVAKGENWQGVLKFAQADNSLPSKGKVLEILTAPMSDIVRERALTTLDGGVTYYRYILPNYYRYLRNGASVLITYTPEAEKKEEVIIPESQNTVILEKEPEHIVVAEPKEEPTFIMKYPIALRTNLLYDAIGAVNLGVEIPIKQNWSAIADFAYAYWRSPQNLYALQTLEYGAELRYWFSVGEQKQASNPNWAKPLKGWNLGVYGRYWQRYDAQWIDGVQGDGTWSAGLTAGYAFPISKQLSFDSGIGAGWVSMSEYRHYHQPEKGHLMWQQTGSWSGFSITKVRLSLVWLIECKKRGGQK